MVAHQPDDRKVVGDHHAVEAELFTEQLRQDLGRPATRKPVYATVRAHNRAQAGITDGGGERLRKDLTQLPRPDLYRRMVAPTLRQAVSQEVLPGGQDAS